MHAHACMCYMWSDSALHPSIMVNINNSVLPVLCGSNLYTMQDGVDIFHMWILLFEVTNKAVYLHYILNLINLILAVELSSN